jgi:hypothetical protein
MKAVFCCLLVVGGAGCLRRNLQLGSSGAPGPGRDAGQPSGDDAGAPGGLDAAPIGSGSADLSMPSTGHHPDLSTPPGGGPDLSLAGGSPDLSRSARAKRIFVTSQTYDGNFGGLSGADETCTIKASALGGSWRAWISDDSTSAFDRIADVGPWYLLDGTTRVFNDRAGLRGTPLAAIDIDDQRNKHNQFVWTGTAVGGTALTGYTCSNWTTGAEAGVAAFGDASTPGDWTNSGAPDLVSACNVARALICLEQ